jgi:hypothetical protein
MKIIENSDPRSARALEHPIMRRMLYSEAGQKVEESYRVFLMEWAGWLGRSGCRAWLVAIPIHLTALRVRLVVVSNFHQYSEGAQD